MQFNNYDFKLYKIFTHLTFLLVLFSPFKVEAQEQNTTLPPVATTIVVLGTPSPVTVGESNRSTTVIDTTPDPLAYSSTEDYLQTDSAIYVQQRGAGGSQADISIRGTSFEQTLVLLNGFRIDDAETSHNNMDLPVPLAAIASINVLHGAGSTLYGSDAIGGVIDFVTRKPIDKSLLLKFGGGNYGSAEQEALGTFLSKKWSEIIAGERTSSSGFMYDRDYRDEEASSETRWLSIIGNSDFLLAGDDRAFGANQFYGNYPSWERTKGWFGSIIQNLNSKTQLAFGYRRHTDEYVLIRSNPSLYENNHIDTSWQLSARRHNFGGQHTRMSYGIEADGDAIHSNNLGIHSRNWGAGYVDATMHYRKASLNAGIRQEIISGGYFVTSPMLAVGFHMLPKIKVRSELGYGFRLPTYLDLYYSDPSTTGNSSLKPESAWNFEAGMDWFPSSRAMLSSTVFYSRQHNTIDYVRSNENQKWRATNLSGLRFSGLESEAMWLPNTDNQLRASWTFLSGAQKVLHGLQSRYIFNYPINNASLEATHTFGASYIINSRINVTERYRSTPYAVWDISCAHESGIWRPYIRITNITNTGYQEILDVQMPGRTVIAGLEISIHHK